MKFFFDTEFEPYNVQKVPDLISIGVVSETGAEFYGENLDYNLRTANPWLMDNVIPHLTGPGYSENLLLEKMKSFVNGQAYDQPVEFCMWVGTYDWFILQQCFKREMGWPANWPWIFGEIKWMQEKFCPMLDTNKIPNNGGPIHHALNDAVWNKNVFDAVQKEVGPGVKL